MNRHKLVIPLLAWVALGVISCQRAPQPANPPAAACGSVNKPVTVYFCTRAAPSNADVIAATKAAASPMAAGICSAMTGCTAPQACKINHVILPNTLAGCTFGPVPAGTCPDVNTGWTCTNSVTFDCLCQ